MGPLPNVKRVDYDARARCKGSRQGREVVTLLCIRLRWTLPACAPTPTDALTPRGITSGLEIVDPECWDQVNVGAETVTNVPLWDKMLKVGLVNEQEVCRNSLYFFFTQFWERRGRRKEGKREEEGWGERRNERAKVFQFIRCSRG